MNKRIFLYLIVGFVACVMVACGQHPHGAGETIEWYHHIGHFFGFGLPADQTSTGEYVFQLGDLLLPGLGTLAAGAIAKARKQVRATRALYESTQAAIDSGALTSAQSKEAVKEALEVAQNLHHDSKLLAKEYQKFKYGGGIDRLKELPNKAVSVVSGLFKK